MALPGLVYRDQLFPRDAYRRLYDAAMEALPERAACKLVVGALAIAHERGCEADLAALIDASLDAGKLPELATIQARFQPDPGALPQVTVTMAQMSTAEQKPATWRRNTRPVAGRYAPWRVRSSDSWRVPWRIGPQGQSRGG